MRIIFLDIDGVLNSVRTGWFNFDMFAVNFLIWVFQLTGCKIVISSSWRHNHNKKFWDKILPDCIHDDYMTPSIYGNKIRGDEIQLWLDKHPEVERYLILDDDTDMKEDQKRNFIQTDPMNGILWDHMDRIMSFFDIRDFPYNGSKESIKKFYINDIMFDLET